MSHGLTTWQKATALVPLALLSGAWTATLVVPTTATAATGDDAKLPDGTSLPDQAIKAPASLSVPGEIAPGIPEGSTSNIVSSASTNGIPAAALAAYQRAAQVIDSADPACNIDWPLIAAIGRVESDHGRYGGNKLTDEGVSTPGIYGIPLDGSNGTAKISDTDAGQHDNDPIYDRAVGPMQFIPSTWSVVGVDGDGDGVRNPQDIDDAALATAVYLCSGDEDLSTDAGQRAAVYRYNHSQAYVDLVLSIMRAYTAGDYASVPNGSVAPATFTPYYGDSVVSSGTSGAPSSRDGRSGGASSGGGTTSTGGGGSNDDGGGTTTPPVDEPGDTGGDPTGSVQDTVDQTEETVKDTLTPLEKATAYCTENLTAAELDAIGGLDACTSAYLDGGASAVQGLLDGLGGVLDGAGGLLGG